jgi:hypothetical protein
MSLTKTLVLALLVAIGTSAIAAKKPSNAFTLRISMETMSDWDTVWDWSGKLSASGALSESGSVTAPAEAFQQIIRFDGTKGSYTIRVTDIRVVGWHYPGHGDFKAILEVAARFEIGDGTGAYQGLTASGTGTGKSVAHSKDGYVSKFTQTWTLNGELDG